MIAHGYLDLMHELDVTCGHSRPRVSNDNTFSESQFKTQKYQPDYPGRFQRISHMPGIGVRGYFDWYNFEHHHSGLGWFTPDQVFTGGYHQVAIQKQPAFDASYRRNTEPFVRGQPCVTDAAKDGGHQSSVTERRWHYRLRPR